MPLFLSLSRFFPSPCFSITLSSYSRYRSLSSQIDGEEDIKRGANYFELTEFMLSLKVRDAVNIDGGGSSVSVYNGMVISKPTCEDTPLICERAVSTITCAHYPNM